MYARIAVATDGSVHGNRAIDTATDLAVKYDDELTVVHVLMHGSSPDTPRHMAETELLVEAHPNADACGSAIHQLYRFHFKVWDTTVSSIPSLK